MLGFLIALFIVLRGLVHMVGSTPGLRPARLVNWYNHGQDRINFPVVVPRRRPAAQRSGPQPAGEAI